MSETAGRYFHEYFLLLFRPNPLVKKLGKALGKVGIIGNKLHF